MKLLLTLGFVGLAFGAQASLFTFDSGAITMNDFPATANLINFNVSGLDGNVTNVGIYFLGMSHESPDDTAAVLFSANGNGTILFDGPGSGTLAPGTTWDWKFDESVTSTKLGNLGTNPTGFYAAGQNQWGDTFSGAPAGPYGTSLLGYNGMSAATATGNWNLYLQDFVGGDFGTIQNVQLRITTSAVPEPATFAVLGLGALALIRRRKNRS